MLHSVAAPEIMRRLVKLAGSIEPPTRAILHSSELAAKATRVIAVRAIVTEAACFDCSASATSLESPAVFGASPAS